MTTATRPYAEVIGDPIAQSKSPIIHGFWLKQLRIEADYVRTQVPRDGLPDFLEDRRADPLWRGCNVTMPLKLDAIAAADQSSDTAIAAGAANLLIPRSGKLFAGNTDVAAIATLIQRQLGDKRPEVVLIGNGGAARAALVALRMLGIDSVSIYARDYSAAVALTVEFRLSRPPQLLHVPIQGDGLINATPMGMGSIPHPPLDLTGISSGGWVFDMVTYPAETDLLKSARASGLTAITGLEMLVEQAADSFGPFFGVEPPRDRDSELFALLTGA